MRVHCIGYPTKLTLAKPQELISSGLQGVDRYLTVLLWSVVHKVMPLHLDRHPQTSWCRLRFSNVTWHRQTPVQCCVLSRSCCPVKVTAVHGKYKINASYISPKKHFSESLNKNNYWHFSTLSEPKSCSVVLIHMFHSEWLKEKLTRRIEKRKKEKKEGKKGNKVCLLKKKDFTENEILKKKKKT